MGGSALKTIETRRLDAPEYHALVPIVLDEVASVVGRERNLCVIESYRQKPSFGDMDILIASDGISGAYKDDIEKVFRSREVYRNGNVTSFDRDGFQVDVIAMPQASFEFAKSYFAWNDLGNLMGRIAHKMGIKYAFEGFMLPLRDGTHMFAELAITRDVDQAMAFLGYDVERYKQGFDTVEEIFRFTASTPYFNPDIYLLENRNATSRVRDAKRKTYSEFLKWLDAPDGLADFMKGRKEPYGGWYVFPEDKSVWHARLREYFPGFGEELDQTLLRKAQHETASALFNGEVVSAISGFTDKPLGELMRVLRAPHATRDALDKWVLSAGPVGVRRAVLEAASALKYGKVNAPYVPKGTQSRPASSPKP